MNNVSIKRAQSKNMFCSAERERRRLKAKAYPNLPGEKDLGELAKALYK